MANTQLGLGAILGGVGMTPDGWRRTDVPGDASIDIEWYRDTAQRPPRRTSRSTWRASLLRST
jgi:hypothetical protein